MFETALFVLVIFLIVVMFVVYRKIHNEASIAVGDIYVIFSKDEDQPEVYLELKPEFVKSHSGFATFRVIRQTRD